MKINRRLLAVKMVATSVTLRELHHLTSMEDACRQWLLGHGLLAANMQCLHCNTAMQEQIYTRVLDRDIHLSNAERLLVCGEGVSSKTQTCP